MNKLIFALILGFLSSFANASYKQTVQLCFNVSENTSFNTLYAKFWSTDVFDSGTIAKFKGNGRKCVEHVYNYGPKHIKLSVGIESDQCVKITADNAMCSYLERVSNNEFRSRYPLTTTTPNQYWEFTLIQRPPVDGYTYTYNLFCKYWVK